MSNATENLSPAATIRPQEAAHFGQLAAQWWDPKGTSAMLHKLNPVRLGFIRDALDAHWPDTAASIRPLAGKRALDVGCGAGLLCEPLARLGADVTGLDAAPENIAAASQHAAAGGLAITYTCADITTLRPSGFHLVTCMEVIEHVADKPAFVAALVDALAPGGLMVLSTPNRTLASKLLLVEGAERLGLVPRGTHHWDDFIAPADFALMLADAGLEVGQPMGIAFSATRGLHLSNDMSLNYILTATKSA
jgi:2-polyprenyl-6-hydroxyphenyl methylase/3-demethylubiquinone-9 3-methyltransferase